MPVTNATPGGTQVNVPYGTGAAPAPRAPSVLAGVGGGLNAAPKAAPRNPGGTNTGKIQAPAAAAQKVGAQVASQNQNVQTQQQAQQNVQPDYRDALYYQQLAALNYSYQNVLNQYNMSDTQDQAATTAANQQAAAANQVRQQNVLNSSLRSGLLESGQVGYNQDLNAAALANQQSANMEALRQKQQASNLARLQAGATLDQGSYQDALDAIDRANKLDLNNNPVTPPPKKGGGTKTHSGGSKQDKAKGVSGTANAAGANRNQKGVSGTVGSRRAAANLAAARRSPALRGSLPPSALIR